MTQKEMKMDVELARRVLKEVKEVFDAHGIEFWLNFGALLGAVRDGKLIEHDDDIEINSWKHKISEQQMRDLCRDLNSRGFSAYYSTFTDYITIWKNNFNISFSMFTLNGDKAERPHEHVWDNAASKQLFYASEIFALKRAGSISKEVFWDLKRTLKFFLVTISGILPEKLRRKISLYLRILARKSGGEWGRTRIPAHFFNDLSDLKFYDMTLRAPREREKYMECLYGSQWRVPMKNWKFYDESNKPNVGIEITNEIWNYKTGLI